MIRRLSLYISLIALCLLTKSCIKEGDFEFRNVKLADNFVYDMPIPLVDAHLTMPDLLKNVQGQYITSDSNGLLKIVYKQEYSYDFSDLNISMPDQSFEFASSSPIIIPAGNLFPIDSITMPTITFWVPLENDPGNPSLRIDSIATDSMRFRLQISTGIRNKVRIELRAPYILDASGKPFSTSVTLPGVRRGNQEMTIVLDLNDYRIIPNNSFPGAPQQLNFSCDVTVFKDAAVATSYPAETVMFAFLEDLRINTVYGFLGRDIIGPIENTIDLPIMDKFAMDLLEVDKADMKLSLTS